jgi:hypothetical protein
MPVVPYWPEMFDTLRFGCKHSPLIYFFYWQVSMHNMKYHQGELQCCFD